MGTRRYSVLGGFFLQDDPEACQEVKEHSSGPEAIPPRFGLKDSSDQRWVNFGSELEQLNKSAPSGTQYKVIFLGRHGEGYHNVAMEKYTTDLTWLLDGIWHRLTGDGDLVWGPDPKLTELGMEQAKEVNRQWKKELEHGIPLPDKLYCSPLSRAIKTNQLTFDGVIKPDLKTMIVENIREKNGVSTCDKRGRKSEIERDFPEYSFEPGFTEEDETWDVNIRETPEEVQDRARKVLDMIFENDKFRRFQMLIRLTIVLSITSHHGFIDSFLRVCSHHPRALSTGGVIPMIIKADQTVVN